MQIRPDNAQSLGGRKQQEDSFGFSSFDQAEVVQQIGLAAVLADGMGGLSHGREASQLAVQSFLRFYSDASMERNIPLVLKQALLFANESVCQFSEEAGLKNQVGSTLIAAVIKDGDLFWVSAGDSRIYLFRDDELIQLTEDHVYANVLNEEVALGRITKEEAENHPQRAALTSFLGLTELEEIDQNVLPFPLKRGDRVLLCSDGVYGFISEEEMKEVLSHYQEHACEELIQKVIEKHHPYQDNVTAILLDCDHKQVHTKTEVIYENTDRDVGRNTQLTENIPRKMKWLSFLLPIILVIFLIAGGFGAYFWGFKQGHFQDLKTKVWSIFQKEEKNPQKQPEESDK